MTKVISFSLWGKNPKYTIGALKNAKLAQTIYPDWVCRFYVSKDVPEDIVSSLAAESNTEVFVMNGIANYTASFWRFYAMADPFIDIMISRDTDSRLSYREKHAVDEWLQSGLPLHIMRDHSWHNSAIMAGMWGCRTRHFADAAESIKNFSKIDAYGIDQKWLMEKVYPASSDKRFVHDEMRGGKPFPTPRNGGEYVGAPFNEKDELEIKFR